ncbi:ABC transporter substrate-binding protein [Cognatiyoonia sp. IB215446]|uniref:heme/hemin ABC transporter substrate-binding protein n=1 Tax=Cognatiyoonia sp. IB215446 TaxID=3097355 RepID=UPI002A0BBDB7|nr:ABC transporter substrate-binding protein [Cognatiyoonia sp. IB215446]MDX8350707.1 ABC transporter substrate-binding protein [Cognatiyoonia sp. IB215446]
MMPAVAQAEGEKNVLAIGGSVTEIIYALGEGDRLIGRDSTSSYPPEATGLPDVGYMRALAPEGVLSVGPGMIISEDGAGPPETIEVLQAANIPFITVPDGYSAEGIVQKILTVGEALDVEAASIALASDVRMKLQEAEEAADALAGDAPKRVLFILSTQDGRIMASGTNTAASGIIEMAGGVNAVTAFEGYKPMSDEAVIAAAPDVILMMDRSGDHFVSDEDLFALPAIATTPAAQTQSVVRMNGLYLLGFGPRTADAVLDLTAALYKG